MVGKRRCWATNNPLYIQYHDEEWGVPIHDDKKLFEFLILGGFQAGISWEIILNKREAFRKSFDFFDFDIISEYDEEKVRQLMNNKSIIRNKSKILATINNAKKVLQIQHDFSSFNKYIWNFQPKNKGKLFCKKFSELPAETQESIAMSKDLKKRGFLFVGPKICYAFMQAVGLVNDHLFSCFRYDEIEREKQLKIVE